MTETVSPQPEDADASTCDFHVVAIGASAGGLEALEAFFRATPTDTGAAFVVVQHLSPDFKSHMEQLLARQTLMPIFRVENGMEVQPNSIYLIPPGKEMIVSEKRLLLTDRERSQTLSHPIDLFFRSVANDLGRYGAAVVLSGTGSDGSRGIRDVHEAGGLVLCQDAESAAFDGMPVNAQETGVVDVVLSPDAMGPAIQRYITGTLSPDMLAEQELPAGELEGMERAFQLLRSAYGIDFANYRATTIGRRIRRRMAITQTGDLAEYIERLAADREQLDLLYHDLLIGVTQFFRDPELFNTLSQNVLPELLARKDAAEPIRGWVSGCATGEEAYSVAIALDEAIAKHGIRRPVKLFATDVHEGALNTAARGIYPESALAKLSEERRSRYFSQTDNGWQVSPELRQMIVFAPHNLLQDAPFTQLDLVTCRNLLIYFQPQAQKKALSFFHFALHTGGALVLGPSETTGELSDEFSVVDKRWKVYKKRRDARLTTNVRLDFSPPLPAQQPFGLARKGRFKSADSELLASYDRLLNAKMPPCFLITENGELLHTFGGAERWLQPQGGRPSKLLADLVETDLSTSISAAVQHALREQREVSYSGLVAGSADSNESLRLIVTPLLGTNSTTTDLLVELSPQEASSASPDRGDAEVGVDQFTKQHVTSLETQLRSTQENLQATVEELETSNEELQATNEELVASNEELQSTNEELHSVNEELHTVNAEHQRKIDELTRVTEDLDNLLSSIQIGVIFLDRELRVRRYTPNVAETFNLLPQDIGRRIDSFSSRIDYDGLLADLETVAERGGVIEREVIDRNGKPYLLRLLEYRSGSSTSGGVLLTLVDIESLKAAQSEIVAGEERFRMLLESTAEGVMGFDEKGLCNFVNPAAVRLLGCESAEQLLGNDLCPYIHVKDESGAIECRVCDSIETGAAVHETDAAFLRADGVPFIAEYWSHPIGGTAGPGGAVVTFFDVTERRRTERQIELQSRIMQLSHDAIIVWRRNGGIVSWNAGAEIRYGFTEDETIGKVTHSLLQTRHPDSWEAVDRALSETGNWTGELEHTTKSGERIRVASRHQLVTGVDGEQLVVEINRDLTETLRVKADLEEAREAAERASRAKSSFLANMSHELRTPLSAVLGFADILLSEIDDETNRERVSTIRSNGAYLLSLLNDILDLSKIEAGKLTTQPSDVEVVDLLSDVARLMRVRAEAKDLTLDFSLRSSVPRTMVTDPRRLRQVLVNLLGNAVKFTDAGRVSLAAGISTEEGQRRLDIEVADTGVGIEEEALKRVFRPFEQAEGRLETTTGGVGLGLSISRLLAQQLGGELNVESRLNEGSRFTIQLPLKGVSEDWVEPSALDGHPATEKADRAAGDNHRLDGHRILVADDRRDIRHVAEYFLCRAGAEVIAAGDGREAIEAVREAQREGQSIDLVLMDMQMPEVDGYEATKRLLEDGFDRPIIALTAAAMKGERERCLTAGCVDYLTKPIDGASLVEVCAARLASTTTSA